MPGVSVFTRTGESHHRAPAVSKTVARPGAAKPIPSSMIFHAPPNSAQMAARSMHLPGKEVAKAVALEAGERKLLAVLPASSASIFRNSRACWRKGAVDGRGHLQ